MNPPVRIVVLDDDPTGIQTVHGCLLLTRWDADALRLAFEDEHDFFYVLTNTRAFQREEACKIVGSIMENILKLNREYGYSLILVSRSDSTLRSHFPTEINAILRAIEAEDGRPMDAIFMVPAFFEAGRLTAGDTHYMVDGGRRIRTSETEFARDSVFGYDSSYLPAYIEEKTHGQVSAKDVASISLGLLRTSDAAPLRDLLAGLSCGRYVVVNAEEYADLKRLADAVLWAVAQGKRFAFQSAASVVKALARVPDQPLLGRQIVPRDGLGLFVVGSHVRKSTRQLECLLEAPQICGIELDVEEALRSPGALLEPTVAEVDSTWADGKTPVLYTSRRELQFDSKEKRLAAGQRVSEFLASVVRSLPAAPAYLVAKGGITSHDILVQGLEVASARVLGQVLPGVPVIATPPGSRFQGMPYVIFPGNVGEDDALLQVFRTLGQAPAD